MSLGPVGSEYYKEMGIYPMRFVTVVAMVVVCSKLEGLGGG